MIAIKSVNKSFGNIHSLKDVSFDIREGSIVGLIGSNGSGKSTLLRIISGIYRQDSGEVFSDGCRIYENADLKRGLVYLSDEQYFLPSATIKDMKKLYMTVYPTFSESKYKKLLSLFELDENRKVSTFSKGMQKQASLLLGLACECKYILCDETFDGLDPVMRRLVKRIIADEVASSKVTAIIASHNLREIEDICDHIALLHHGELLLEASLDDIKLNLHKIQFVLEEGTISPCGFEVLSSEARGKLTTMIVKGELSAVEDCFADTECTYFEVIPLTLEEIFITEMGGRGYDCSKIIF